MTPMKHMLRFAPALPALVLLFLANTVSAANTLENPLSVGGLADFVALALKVMVMVALPIISLFIVYSGFLFVSARGNSEQLDKAKMNLLYVIIGAILILGAWVIATLIGGTVTQLVRG